MRMSLGMKLLLAGLLMTVGSFGTCTVALATGGGTGGAGGAFLGPVVGAGFLAGIGLMGIGGIMAIVQAIMGSSRRNDPPDPPPPPKSPFPPREP